MNSLILPPRIDAPTALARFRRRRFLNLFGLLPSRPVKAAPDGTPLSLELVWLPAYAFQVELHHGGKQHRSWVSVDASFGGFALFGRMDALVEQPPEGEVFPPVVEAAAAEQVAREELVRYIMRKRGAKPGIDSIGNMRYFLAPVWLYYFRRAGGKIDFSILDGYSGDLMGGRMKQAILNGMIARRQRLATAGEAEREQELAGSS